jgi:hypothetical protein
VEHFEGLMDQVQDEVMETKREQWPMCPAHPHELHARTAGDWIEWQCSQTGRPYARLGELVALGQATNKSAPGAAS